LKQAIHVHVKMELQSSYEISYTFVYPDNEENPKIFPKIIIIIIIIKKKQKKKPKLHVFADRHKPILTEA
jgi:hypothetical protein